MSSQPQVQILTDKLAQFSDPWNPRLLAQLNGQHVKIAKLEGPFVWHHHEHEDELFLVIEGTLKMEMRDAPNDNANHWHATLNPGELIVIPRGLEHRPVAKPTCSVLLFEPATTLNTGSAEHSELTRTTLEEL